jgi:hypothetical protein
LIAAQQTPRHESQVLLPSNPPKPANDETPPRLEIAWNFTLDDWHRVATLAGRSLVRKASATGVATVAISVER